MTKLIILSFALAAAFLVVKNPPNKEAVLQLQRLNDNLERLRDTEMRFPARVDQKFSA